MVDALLQQETSQESDLRAAHAALLEEFETAEDEVAHESDLREVLLAELAEREPYSAELHARLLNAEEARGTAAADVSNVRTDIEKLHPEIHWAENYCESVAVHRSKLQAEVCEAEHSLLERRRDVHARDIAGHLAVHDLLREEQRQQAVEVLEAKAASRWTEAITEIQLQRTNLQIQLMREEHQQQAAANELEALRCAPMRPSDIREMALLV
jgi:hypothetical protein